ncbi:PREDICTED: probable galacturonosyltransferase 4 isoform X2 [Populus euphratica]|uniref:Hexosyltransferase n=1 Tax=Populus euphratica TaxID=75702 RepID=A0AAJ6T7P9_POPEU|nr:PREDICTED: probable galacturonosyltransferase 4 isoform X2 [Populus euphratica]
MRPRNLVFGLLLLSVLAPILLYTDSFSSFTPSFKQEFLEDVTAFILPADTSNLNVLPQGESSAVLKAPIGILYTDNHSKTILTDKGRALSATDEDAQSRKDDIIEQVIQSANQEKEETRTDREADQESHQLKQRSALNSDKVGEKDALLTKTNKQTDQLPMPAAWDQQLRDQLIKASVYLSLPAMKSNRRFTRELRMRIKEVQRVLGDAIKDSAMPKNAYEKWKAMDQLLEKGKQMQYESANEVKKLRAMLHSTEEQLRVHKKQTVSFATMVEKLRAVLHSTEEQLQVHKKQTMFLTQLTAKTLPKGLHCLPLRLTTEYYNLNSSEQQFPNQEILDNPLLHHIALFSDNVLAAAVVVNSTVTNSKHPSKLVFHLVSDRLNYAAMRMWFLVNPPGKATIQVQNIDEFTWLNSSYSPVLKQLHSQSMIDYYFRAHGANSDSNLKYRNPKYLSILNHLRFYLPEIFPKLNKVLFLDDDIVVQKDLTGLWSLDLKGNVNGAVETCRESFHRFDTYLNFSNPLISNNFDPRACGWAYGMNLFDLEEWKRQNITDVYHSWQKLNHDRQLWKLGTLPPGLITLWKRTHPLDRRWHVLGLGYNPIVSQIEIERGAVIHYNGNMKPWLEIGIPKYRKYWAKYVDYDNVYLRECNINP